MAIRFDKDFNKEIRRIVKNYNRRIDRMELGGNYAIPEFIPARVSVKQLKATYTDRSLLQRRLKELDKVRESSSEIITLKSGLKLPRFEYEQFKQNKAAVKRALTIERSRLTSTKLKFAGRSLGFSRAELGDTRLQTVEATQRALQDEIDTLNASEYAKQSKIIARQIKRKIAQKEFYSNYLDMLFDTGREIGYDEEKIKFMTEKLARLNDVQFTNLFNDDEAIKRVVYYYSMQSHSKDGEFTDEQIQQLTDVYDELWQNFSITLRDYE